MSETKTIRSILGKAARIVLVFALVFGTTLSWEYSVAYGYGPVIVDDGSGHQGESLTDLVIYEWSAEKDAWLTVTRASHSGSNPITITMAQDDGARQFAAMPIYDGSYPEGDSIAQVTSATFAEWSFGNGSDPCLDMAVRSDNIVDLSVTASGGARLECKAGDLPAAVLVLSTTVPDAPEPEPNQEPTLEEVAILNDKGSEFASEPQLIFGEDDAGKTYQLQARVKVANLEGKELFETKNGESLSEFSGGILGNLEWTTSDPAVATIDDSGLVTVVGQGQATLTCVARIRTTSLEQAMADAIRIEVGNPDKTDDPQGIPHPQPSLQVIAHIPAQASPSDGEDDDPSTSGGTPSGEASGSSTASAEAASGESEGATTPGREAIDIDRIYTVEQLESMNSAGTLPFDTRTFSMRNGNGPLTIIGNGFSVMDLLNHAFQEAGLDLDEESIETVDFIDYRGIRTTLPWSTVKGLGAQMALRSYVETTSASSGNSDSSTDSGEEGVEGSSEGSPSSGAAASTTPELLDNTRFRLLFDGASASVDADALRYLKAIQLNMAATTTDELAVGISYVPVPLGVEAEFVASPNHNINGRWDCRWDRSRDGGATWERIEGAVSQTLRVLTTSQSVGTFYRVTIDNATSMDIGESLERLSATSEPVEMRIGGGFAVVLSYNPPKAGDMAVFRSSIYDYTGDVSRLDYVWEYSEDGGANWTVIKNERKSTLKIPTEPVDEDGSGGEGGGEEETPNLVYIRVRAITPDEEVRISNVQPLTVHVGDADTDISGDDDDGRVDGSAGPTGSDPSKPSHVPPSEPTIPGPRPMTPIDAIVMESSAEPAAALDPNGTSSTPQIYVNETVSEQVMEQQEAIQEQRAQSTPGARWTALKTLNPNADDIRRVLENNPLVPFVAPFALGLVAVGALEKLISYRRQLA